MLLIALLILEIMFEAALETEENALDAEERMLEKAPEAELWMELQPLVQSLRKPLIKDFVVVLRSRKVSCESLLMFRIPCSMF